MMLVTPLQISLPVLRQGKRHFLNHRKNAFFNKEKKRNSTLLHFTCPPTITEDPLLPVILHDKLQ
jgi:hypothetical protein